MRDEDSGRLVIPHPSSLIPRPWREAMREPIVQVSLDLMTIAEAMPVAETAVRAGVDWLEAGTPLILGEGIHAVKALRGQFPRHPIVEDMKSIDASNIETVMIEKASANHVVV